MLSVIKIYCHVLLYTNWRIFITKGKSDVDNFAQGPTIVLNKGKRERLFTYMLHDHFQDNGKYLENL